MLIGRAAETARIDAMLAEARHGRSAALVIRGEPGVGKSALLDYAAGVANGLRVLRCAGIESEAELAFAALHALLRPGLDSLNVLPMPQSAALRVLAEAHGNPLALLELPLVAAQPPVLGALPLPQRLQEAYRQEISRLPFVHAVLGATEIQFGRFHEAATGEFAVGRDS